mmetsp:Transcript_13114/g.23345  ORF Transcript_13114/g.23345 Transcript_13114/m.23345 type:complete len:209 (-) Transcript_13114:1755-2381(-)
MHGCARFHVSHASAVSLFTAPLAPSFPPSFAAVSATSPLPPFPPSVANHSLHPWRRPCCPHCLSSFPHPVAALISATLTAARLPQLLPAGFPPSDAAPFPSPLPDGSVPAVPAPPPPLSALLAPVIAPSSPPLPFTFVSSSVFALLSPFEAPNAPPATLTTPVAEKQPSAFICFPIAFSSHPPSVPSTTPLSPFPNSDPPALGPLPIC